MSFIRRPRSARSASALDKRKRSLRSLKPSARRLTQVYAAVLYNAHIRGFFEGKIYTGRLKTVCVPGLNCYSCPGAVGACPLGALQNAVAASASRPGFYVIGTILLFGLLLGRAVCGWACPMGLLQELLWKIPGKKLKKNRVTRRLCAVKYVLLAVLVLLVPLLYAIRRVPLPAFCKFVCPAGTLEGAVMLMLHPANGELRNLAGPLFFWKLAVMLLIFSSCVFVFRAFCRFLCPLGAIYGLLAKIALLGVRIDRDRCVDCGACVRVCPMDISSVGDRECVQCGKCMTVCAHGAISVKAGRVTLAPSVPLEGKGERT